MLAVNDRPGDGLGSWKMRRRFMWMITFFCMFCVTKVMYTGADTQVNQAIIMWSFLCMGGVMGSYVFGAAWQDIRTTQSMNRKKGDD